MSSSTESNSPSKKEVRPWSEADEDYLLTERSKEPPTRHQVIADHLGRTNRSCRIRLHNLLKRPKAASSGGEEERGRPARRRRRSPVQRQSTRAARVGQRLILPARPKPKSETLQEQHYQAALSLVTLGGHQGTVPTPIVPAVEYSPVRQGQNKSWTFIQVFPGATSSDSDADPTQYTESDTEA